MPSAVRESHACARNDPLAGLLARSVQARSLQRATAIKDDLHLESDLLADNTRLDDAFHNSPTLRPSDDRAAIKLLQEALESAFEPLPGSHDPETGELDGKWGPETTRIVRKYQSARGVPPGGSEAGRRTLAALDADLKSGPKPGPGPAPGPPPTPKPHPTGPQYEPGEVEESFVSPGIIEEVPEGFLLSGFGVGKRFSKPEHKAFLKKLVQDRNLTDPDSDTFIVGIVGFTDGVDQEALNLTLREDRSGTVGEFLTGNLEVPADNVGPELAAKPGEFRDTNATRAGRAHNRAVLIRFGSQINPKPHVEPNPVPVPPGGCNRTQTSTKWALQSNLSATLPAKPGVAITTLNFILIDKSPTGCKRLLQFTGFGGGFGVSFPASVAIPSPTDFATRSPLTAKDFEGGGAIRQANIGLGFGFGEMIATLHPRAAPDVDVSGFQLSLGIDASIVGGTWTLLD